MHIRSALNRIAQRRYLESILHDSNIRQLFAAADILAGKANIVETVIRKVPTGMTGHTICFVVKQVEPAFGVRGNSRLVASKPSGQKAQYH